jgi:Superfamily II DNA and RNA helicases
MKSKVQKEKSSIDESTTSTEEMAKEPLSTPSAPPAAPNSFESINPPLSQGVLAAISRYGFKTMTPVQKATIPLFLTNKDVCVQAVTGSGKTLAFLIPMVEIILRRTALLTKNQVGGLVISPTRELARQTYDIAKDLCKFASLTEPLLLVGGGGGHRPVTADLDAFAKAGSDIVIGTPGRIDDILSRYNDLQVNELECLVLDEADVLLDMGFEVTLTSILSKLPKMRRTGLFSATKSGTSAAGASAKSVKKLMARARLRNPVMINVAIAAALEDTSSKKANTSSADHGLDLAPQEQATPSSLTNYYVISPLDEKLSRLVAFLKQHKDEKVIVFFLTCACVEFYGLALQQLLRSDTYYIETLHGKLAPKRREKAMERFRSGGSVDESGSTSARKAKGSILLCTDVAARGLDVPDIEWTVQFDAPVDPSQYIHRVGRSARAGRIGSSLIFLTPKEDSFIDFLRNRKVPITEIGNDERCAPSVSFIENATNDGQEDKVKISNVLPKIRQLVLEDRDLLEKGTKAYTSYIRAYKEHQCAFIFR